MQLIIRLINNRDKSEKSFNKSIIEIDKRVALMSKDIEHAINLSKAVSDLSERVSKLHYDVNFCFKHFRELKKN